MSSNIAIFLSGRAVTLGLLMAVQIVIVRALEPAQYAIYALIFGVFALLQVGASLGIPKVITQIIPRAGWEIKNQIAWKLVLALLSLRLAVSAFFLFSGASLAVYFGLIVEPSIYFAVISALFVLTTILQIDVDAIAQALRLQRASRNALVIEAMTRFSALLGLYILGSLTLAVQIMAITCVTLMASSFAALYAIFQRLQEPDQRNDIPELEQKQLRSMAWSAYMSSAAWFTTSPPMMRLLGGYFLAVHPFAAFSFAQALVLSIQRFTPASLLLPFVEPAIVRDYSRSGSLSKLENSLSLLIKIDMIVIGAGVIVTGCCGRALVDWVTDNKYGDYAFVFPFLLMYIGSNSVYRSFEVAALAVGVRSQLSLLLASSLLALIIAVALIPFFGLVVLLLCPIADAACRLILVDRMLHRIGVKRVVDIPIVGSLCGAIAVLSLAGSEIGSYQAAIATLIATTVLAIVCYVFIVLVIRPIRSREWEDIGMSRHPLGARIMTVIARD